MGTSSSNISQLTVNGQTVRDKIRIQTLLKEFYVHLYSKKFLHRPTLSGMNLKQLDNGVNDAIEVQFLEGDIRQDMDEHGGDKTPVPMVFKSNFIVAAGRL